MDFQDLFPALQVRKLYRDPPVESSRTQERRVQAVRAVGRRQDDYALGSVKAVHLRQELVQRLLALVISGKSLSVSFLSDRIDLIDKDDTRRFLVRLLEEVAHLGRTHADEHLYEL